MTIRNICCPLLVAGAVAFAGLAAAQAADQAPRSPNIVIIITGVREGHVRRPLIRQNAVVNPDVRAADQEMLTTWYMEHAVNFIRRHRDCPFLFHVPHTMVHTPLYVSDWKLLDRGNGWMLYNLVADIAEKHDLFRQEATTAEKLQAAYAEWDTRNIPPRW